MLDTFSFGVSSNLSQQKSPTVEIIGIYFLGTIVLRKYMPKISAVGLFCCDKFEETPNKKVSDLSKLTKPYFNNDRDETYFSWNEHKQLKSADYFCKIDSIFKSKSHFGIYATLFVKPSSIKLCGTFWYFNILRISWNRRKTFKVQKWFRNLGPWFCFSYFLPWYFCCCSSWFLWCC